MRVAFRNDLFKGKFKQDRVEILYIRVMLERHNKRRGEWKTDEVIDYKFPVFLYPRNGSSITVSGRVETLAYQASGEACERFVTLDNHCADDCSDQTNFPYKTR